jgi:hypothetical protein
MALLNQHYSLVQVLVHCADNRTTEKMMTNTCFHCGDEVRESGDSFHVVYKGDEKIIFDLFPDIHQDGQH